LESDVNGWKLDARKGTISIGVGAIVALTVAAYVNIANQTAVAIQVARDHGSELKLLRQDYTALRGEMTAHRQQALKQMDDRFRGTDWERERRWIEGEFIRIEKRIGQCCNR
jgi:hypothetical protein